LNKPKEAEEVRQNVLNLLSARVLAGKKMTAQEIADQLDITIEEAQIAVLSPIGEEIQIATPDLSRLSQNGTKESAAAIAVPIVFTIIIGGGIILSIYVINGDTIVTATDKTGREIWRRTGDAAQDLARKYFPGIFPANNPINPPERLPGFPDAKKVKPKTPVQGGGKLRKRWKDSKGDIYEWDYQHGAVEKYNKKGKHQGEFDPNTGKQTKPADKNRRVEP
jgi:hypothetical protein